MAPLYLSGEENTLPCAVGCSASEPCGARVRSPKSFQYHEAMVHAIRLVNQLTSVLRNVTLGFVILDDCTKDQVTSHTVFT